MLHLPRLTVLVTIIIISRSTWGLVSRSIGSISN
jgi:hypothetical protein